MASKNITTQPQTPVSPQMIVQRLSDQVDIEGLNLPSNTEGLWDFVVECEINAAKEHIKAGIAYKALKESLLHGEFEKGLKERGIKARLAQKRMAVADLFIGFANTPARAHLDNFSYTGLRELTQLPEAKIRTFEAQELEELSQLPSRALATRVKEINHEFRQKDKLEVENERLKKRSERDEQTIMQLNNKLGQLEMNHLPTELQESPILSDIKARVPELTEQVNLAALELASMSANLDSINLSDDDRTMASHTLYHFLQGPYLRLKGILASIEDRFGDLSEQQMVVNYEEQDWHRANDRREILIHNFERRHNPHKFQKSPAKKGK